MTFKISNELHERAVVEIAPRHKAGADSFIRKTHQLAAKHDAGYVAPSSPRHPRFGELPQSLQQTIIDGESKLRRVSLEVHRSQLVGLYTVSGLSQATAEAIVQFATSERG